MTIFMVSVMLQRNTADERISKEVFCEILYNGILPFHLFLGNPTGPVLNDCMKAQNMPVVYWPVIGSSV